MSNMIPLNDLEKMAVAIGKNGMFGKTAEQLLPLMLIAQAQGRHPATVAMDYDVIQGRPAINSRATLSRFQLSGGRIEWQESNDKTCTAVFSHPQGGSITIQWTIERATKAGLTGKQTWKQYPDQMLRARCIAEGVRATFPACLDGLYTVEEVQDFGSSRRENVGWRRESQMEPVEVDHEIVDDSSADIQALQISDAMKGLRDAISDAGIDWLAFQEFLRAKGKLPHDMPLIRASDELAQRIISTFDVTATKFAEWNSAR